MKEMKIVRECAIPLTCKVSAHFAEERKARINLVKAIGIGDFLNAFLVDCGHKNGPEIHIITDTGLILVLNKETKVLATILIARPGQIRRYYQAIGKRPEETVLAQCSMNCAKGFNNI